MDFLGMCKGWICGEEAPDRHVEYMVEENSHLDIKSNFRSMISSEFGDPHLDVTKFQSAQFNLIVDSLGQDKFDDKQFPPTIESLGDFGGLQKNVEWIRISDIIKDPVIFQRQIKPDDILQGNVGDCYLMSVLSSLAQRPNRVQRLFLHSDPKRGIYTMLMRQDGIPKQIVVDDYLPTIKSKPMFSKIQPGSREVWVMIIEKMWAKHCGSYKKIQEGYPHIVMDSFGQGPSFYFNLQQEHWPYFQSACKFDFPICLGSKIGPELEKTGLIRGHSYTVIDAVQDKDTKAKLVRLRNPWGQVQWKGRYNDNCPLWNKVSKHFKERIKFSKEKDGFFFIEWQDVLKYFASFDICYIIPGSNYEYEQFDITSGQSQYFQFTLTQPSYTCISIHVQKPGMQSGKLTALLSKLEKKADQPTRYEFISSASDQTFNNVNLTSSSKIQPGIYQLYVKFEQGNNRRQLTRITLSSYSMDKPDFKHLSRVTIKQNGFLPNSLMTHSFKHGKCIREKQYEVRYDFLDGFRSEFGYIMITVYKESKKKIKVEIDPSDYTRIDLTLKKPFKLRKTVNELTAGMTMMVVCRNKFQPIQKQQREKFTFPPNLSIKESLD